MPSLEALLLGTKRSIEPTTLSGQVTGEAIIPDVVISEAHTDDVTITKHPVDTGANISDHAFAEPAMITCTFGWSDSSRLINELMSGIASGGLSGAAGAVQSLLKGKETTKDVYAKLLELKNKRTPLKLSTSKRVYDCVLIQHLQTVTSVDTENSAIIEVTFVEIKVAKARTVTLTEITQANASKTAGTNHGGQRYAKPIGTQLLEGTQS